MTGLATPKSRYPNRYTSVKAERAYRETEIQHDSDGDWYALRKAANWSHFHKATICKRRQAVPKDTLSPREPGRYRARLFPDGFGREDYFYYKHDLPRKQKGIHGGRYTKTRAKSAYDKAAVQLMDGKLFYTVRKIAEYANESCKVVRKAIEKGHLTKIKLPGALGRKCWYISKSQVDHWLATMRKPASARISSVTLAERLGIPPDSVSRLMKLKGLMAEKERRTGDRGSRVYNTYDAALADQLIRGRRGTGTGRKYAPIKAVNNLPAPPADKPHVQSERGRPEETKSRKRPGRKKGWRSPRVAQRTSDLLAAWDRKELGDNKAAYARKYAFHRSDATKLINKHDEAKCRK
jgi:hypothetical protein